MIVTEQFPCISAVLNVLQLLPVTSAEVERVHSAFKLLKAKIKSTMRIDRLNALLLLYYHKDNQLAYEAILDICGRRHPGRMVTNQDTLEKLDNYIGSMKYTAIRKRVIRGVRKKKVL